MEKLSLSLIFIFCLLLGGCGDEGNLYKPELIVETSEIRLAPGVHDIIKKARLVEEFPRWDVNGDGIVDISDLVLVGIHFGEEYSVDTYTNYEFGFQISRPNANWKICEGEKPEEPLVSIESQKMLGVSANVIAFWLQFAAKDIEQFGQIAFQNVKAELEKDNIKLQVISESVIELNGIPAYDVIYIAEFEVQVKVRQLILTKDLVVCVITLGAPIGVYDAALPELNQIANSFRFIK